MAPESDNNEAGFRKPTLRLKLPVRRLVGPVAVGHRMSGLKRKREQALRIGGYWTMLNGKPVFVRRTRPITAEDRLARLMDRQKKKRLGQYGSGR